MVILFDIFQICCPVAEYIDDPGDYEGDDEDDANYECTPSELGGNQDKCDANRYSHEPLKLLGWMT